MKLIAHRGYRKFFPENTFLAIEEAILEGAEYVEIDLQLSADHEFVLYHDPELNRVSGINARVDSLDFSDLLLTPAYEPERLGNEFNDVCITPFYQFVGLLSQHPGVTAFVEIKEDCLKQMGAATLAARLIEAVAEVSSQVVFISYAYSLIHEIKKQGFKRRGIILRSWNEVQSVELAKLQPEVVFCNYKKVPQAGSLVLPFAKLALYEIADPDLAHALCVRGAEYIETFEIAEMLNPSAFQIDQIAEESTD
ncbi:MAG: hypothetical protein KDI30_06215 [Pseudomonadales bacterium]|nr:hypothetical protein [Pseudomonadales bacterium]